MNTYTVIIRFDLPKEYIGVNEITFRVKAENVLDAQNRAYEYAKHLWETESTFYLNEVKSLTTF